MSPTFALFTYCFKQPPATIPSGFIAQCKTLLQYLDNGKERESSHEKLKLDYSEYQLNPQTDLKTFISYTFEEEFQRTSYLLESVLFVPLSSIQAACLDALYLRWQFLLSKYPKTNSFMISYKMDNYASDCISSIFTEMYRINLHPMLAGCSERAVVEKHSTWNTAFLESSGKMLALNYCMDAFFQVGVSETIHSRRRNRSSVSSLPPSNSVITSKSIIGPVGRRYYGR